MVTYIDAASLAHLVSAQDAVAELRRALIDGLDPEADEPRIATPVPGGSFLLMPSASREFCGVKVLAVAPDNPLRGRPRIQGLYTLFDRSTMEPVSVLDAEELTLLRTAAVTTLAAGLLLAAKATTDRRASTAVVVGTGPQAERHAQVLSTSGMVRHVAVLGRTPAKVQALVARLRQTGYAVRGGVPDDLSLADLIVTATSSVSPVLDVDQVRPDAVVCGIGAHEPNARELSAALVQRSDIVVEARSAAMRESGNLLLVRPGKQWAENPIPNLADLARGEVRLRPGRAAVFSAVGMAWQDLVLASLAYRRHTSVRSRRRAQAQRTVATVSPEVTGLEYTGDHHHELG
jgi:ornithine cyclodeaminase